MTVYNFITCVATSSSSALRLVASFPVTSISQAQKKTTFGFPLSRTGQSTPYVAEQALTLLLLILSPLKYQLLFLRQNHLLLYFRPVQSSWQLKYLDLLLDNQQTNHFHVLLYHLIVLIQLFLFFLKW